MDKESRSLWLSVLWTTGIGVVLILVALVAGAGIVPRIGVVALGLIGWLSISAAVWMHGWLKAPFGIGAPIRATSILGLIAVAMAALCWAVWPPVKRHELDDDERAKFEAPLKKQVIKRYEIHILCPAIEESTCVYARQFVEMFRDAGWKVQTNEVQRVTMKGPLAGVWLFEKGTGKLDPDNWRSGLWTRISPTLVSTTQAFENVGVEPDVGSNPDLQDGILAIYFGLERADEGKATPLTGLMEKYRDGSLPKPQ